MSYANYFIHFCPVRIHHFWKRVMIFRLCNVSWFVCFPFVNFLFLLNLFLGWSFVFICLLIIVPEYFNECTNRWIHLYFEHCNYKAIFILYHFLWYLIDYHCTIEFMSLNFYSLMSLQLIEVVSIIEYNVDKVLLTCESYENNDVLLFNEVNRWTPIFSHHAFSVY